MKNETFVEYRKDCPAYNSFGITCAATGGDSCIKDGCPFLYWIEKVQGYETRIEEQAVVITPAHLEILKKIQKAGGPPKNEEGKE